MKITPLEIRQKEFEKKLRGYDKDEVTAFLLSLSNEWERLLDTNKELTIKLQHAEKEVSKLREVESSLYKTLKTAEDTGANLIDQSNKAAELHMKETQMRAEGLMNEAKSKAKGMMEKAEVEARQIIEELQEAVKNIEQNHRDIENHRQNAIAELKNLSVDLIEKVERTNNEQKHFKFDDYAKRVKELARESGERIRTADTELKMPDTPKIEDFPEDKKEDPDPVPQNNNPADSRKEDSAIQKEKESAVRVTNIERSTQRISRTVIVDTNEPEPPEIQEVQPATAAKSEPKEEKREPVNEKVPEPENVEKKPEVAEPESFDEEFEVVEEEHEEPVAEEPEVVAKAKEKQEELLEAVEKEPEPLAEAPEPKEAVPASEPSRKAARTVSFFDQLDSDD